MGLRPTQGDEKRGLKSFRLPQNCHPDRSEAKWRDLLFGGPFVEMLFDRAQRGGEICGSTHPLGHVVLTQAL
jgi:hypothetical protein